MNSLSRIPLWGWYLFSVLYCYLIWNPWASLYQVVSGDANPALKTICIMLAAIIAALYITEGHRTLNTFGIILFAGLFGSILWAAFYAGFRGFGTFYLWGQWIVGLLLTLALQGGRIYRSLTGRVPVGNSVEHDVDHHY